jgi:hypothetical protein
MPPTIPTHVVGAAGLGDPSARGDDGAPGTAPPAAAAAAAAAASSASLQDAIQIAKAMTYAGVRSQRSRRSVAERARSGTTLARRAPRASASPSAITDIFSSKADRGRLRSNAPNRASARGAVRSDGDQSLWMRRRVTKRDIGVQRNTAAIAW